MAAERCTRVGWAVTLCVIDYKMLFRKTWDDSDEGRAQRHEDYEATHLKCAVRLREVLKKNGGIYIKVRLEPLPLATVLRTLEADGG